ncbi:unnamed protein product [Closterium sp. Yama58-4]|nr:unnamed protein product [Closterium sp. Yama58-4]
MRARFNATNDRVPLAPKAPIRPNTSIAVDWVTKGGKNAVHRGDSKFVPRPGVKEEGPAVATSATRPPADSNSAVADLAASAAAGASESNTGYKGNGSESSGSADSDTWEARIRALEEQLEKANVETAFLKARNTELQARLLDKDNEPRPHQVVKTRLPASIAAAKAVGDVGMRGAMGVTIGAGVEGRGNCSRPESENLGPVDQNKSSSGGDAGGIDSSSGRSSGVSGDEERGREDAVTGRGEQWSTVEDGVTRSNYSSNGMPLELQLAAAHARIAVLERILKARANQSSLPRLPSASSTWKPIPRPPMPSPASQAPPKPAVTPQHPPKPPTLAKQGPVFESTQTTFTGVQHEGRRDEGLSVGSQSVLGGNAGMSAGMGRAVAEDSGADGGLGTEAVAEGGVVLVVRPWDSEGVSRLQQELAEAKAVQQATVGKLKAAEQQLGRLSAVREEVEGGVVLVVRPWDSEGVARLQQELAEARAVQQATVGKLKVVEQQLGRLAAVREEVSACCA